MNVTQRRPARLRALRVLVVAILVLLAVQGWLGDMGGSYIGALASYFLVLYHTK